MAPRYSNHLAGQTSPYLLQHAHNPVDWFAWGEDALETARANDKPILLSIGYSACHWCHVMEHESFQDEETAKYMNQYFVSIKVDREERPDLDKIYQTAHQLLTQRPGGWPLTMALGPTDHAPFFAGTYFPKTPRHGMPAFIDVLKRVASYYEENKAQLATHAQSVCEALVEMDKSDQAAPNLEVLDRAVAELIHSFDSTHGGFGRAPKFPHPGNIELCLRKWAQHRDAGLDNPRALHIARHTLENMARGGLYDQLGAGFYRYSVDDRWSIPHFEKMLYDNAQLLPLYVDAWLATGDGLFKDTALGTAEWVMREMQSAQGGYYSSLDADSEGAEGKFYVWSTAEIQGALTQQEYSVVEAHYALNGEPNFEGRWHLNVAMAPETIAQTTETELQGVRMLLASSRRKLLQLRGQRIRPNRDEKILTSWNALMIRGMAYAGRRLNRQDFLDSANNSLQFVRSTLWRDRRLLATAKDDVAHLNAYLDDYVFLIDAILELVQSDWQNDMIQFAIRLADTVLGQFNDPDNGGLFFTAQDHEKLLHRTKPKADDAIPSGNGIGARVLLRLGHLIDETRYLDAAEDILRSCTDAINQFPAAHAALVIASDEYLLPPETIVLRAGAEDLRPWIDRNTGYNPKRTLYPIPNGAPGKLPGMLADRVSRGDFTAYVCRGTACSAPITDSNQLEAVLGEPPISS